MRTLHILWTVLWNLVSLAIFGGMLAIAKTSFQMIVIAGLALVYVAVVTYGSLILRGLVSQAQVSANRHVRLVRMVGNSADQQEANVLEQDVLEQLDHYKKMTIIYYINMAFLLIIWLIAVTAIITSL